MVLYVWIFYSPLEFQFHAMKLGLEFHVCFEFHLLASLPSCFSGNISRTSSWLSGRVLWSPCSGAAFSSPLCCFNPSRASLPSSSAPALRCSLPVSSRMVVWYSNPDTGHYILSLHRAFISISVKGWKWWLKKKNMGNVALAFLFHVFHFCHSSLRIFK